MQSTQRSLIVPPCRVRLRYNLSSKEFLFRYFLTVFLLDCRLRLLHLMLTLNADTRSTLKQWLQSDTLLVACLCAAWCDVCSEYRAIFSSLASQHAEANFIWIDIEEHADLIGDIDVDNFPTLLIQRGPHVTFFGSVPPGLQVAHRLIQAQCDKSLAELAAEAESSVERQRWQSAFHLAPRFGND